MVQTVSAPALCSCAESLRVLVFYDVVAVVVTLPSLLAVPCPNYLCYHGVLCTPW